MCIILAGFNESRAPGSFSDCLEGLLKANNLPSINLGSYSPPVIGKFLHSGLAGILGCFSSKDSDEGLIAQSTRRRSPRTPLHTVEDTDEEVQPFPPTTSGGSSRGGTGGGGRGGGGRGGGSRGGNTGGNKRGSSKR